MELGTHYIYSGCGRSRCWEERGAEEIKHTCNYYVEEKERERAGRGGDKALFTMLGREREREGRGGGTGEISLPNTSPQLTVPDLYSLIIRTAYDPGILLHVHVVRKMDISLVFTKSFVPPCGRRLL